MLHFKIATACALLSAVALGQLQGGGHGVSVRRTGCHLDLDSHADCDVRANGVPLGGLSDTVNAMSSTIAAMQSAATVQSAAAEARHATQDATIAALVATVGEQAGCCTATANPTTPGPSTAAPPTTIPSTSPTSAASTTCEGRNIHSDAELAAAVPVYRTCIHMTRTLRIGAAPGATVGGVTNTTLLAEAFPNLQTVEGVLYVIDTPNLASIDGAFPNLQTVGGGISINNNALLTSIGSSFGSLRSVGGNLIWVANGGQGYHGLSTTGSRSFCASAAARLCPTTTSHFNTGVDGALDCCTAYCATTTAC